MLKKRIKFEDFNGEEREEDFYFNLTKTELVKWELGTTGGLQSLIQKIVDTQDNAALLKIFDDIISMAYGVRSDDGKRFIKSKELTDEFRQTNAYDVMFMNFMQNPDEYNEFLKAIIPTEVSKEMEQKG